MVDGRLMRLLAATAAVLAVGAAGFTAGAAATDGDPVGERQGMHDDPHAHMGSGHDRRDMEQMHAEMMEPLSPEERQLHHRMHRSCTGDTNDRSDT